MLHGKMHLSTTRLTLQQAVTHDDKGYIVERNSTFPAGINVHVYVEKGSSLSEN